VAETSAGVAAATDVEIIEEPQQMVGMPGFGLG
jgi:hypothetical protein